MGAPRRSAESRQEKGSDRWFENMMLHLSCTRMLELVKGRWGKIVQAEESV